MPCIALLLLALASRPVAAQRIQYLYDEVGNVVEVRRLSADELALIQFSPLRGPPGTLVTLDGQGFHPDPRANAVRINGTAATIVSGSRTELVVAVPQGATSGPVSVSNGAATATADRPFTVATGPSIAAFTPGVGSVGAPVVVQGANFDPLPINDRLSFGATAATVSGASPSSLSTTVPGGASSGRLSLGTPSGSTVSGSDFFVVPPAYAAGNAGFTGRLALGGGGLPVAVAPGKFAMVAFDGNAGDAITVYLNGLSYTGGSVAWVLLGSANAQIASGSVTTSVPWAVLPALSASGTYTLLLNPGTGSFSANLQAAAAVRLPIDNGAAAGAIATAGRPIRVAFTASAGQTLGIGLTGLNLSPASATSVTVDVLRPDGGNLQTVYCYASGDRCSTNLTVSVTGTHSLWIRPPAGATGSVQAWASRDVAATLVAGAPYALHTASPGQNARLSFAAPAGTGPALEFTGVATSPPGQPLSLAVYRPDGGFLATTAISAGASTWTLPAFPIAGTYLLFVEPSPTDKGAATIESARITVENGTPIIVDGVSSAGSFASAGESARFTFDGTSGQQLGLGFTGLALTPSTASSAVFTVFRPDGSVLTNGLCYVNGDRCSANLRLGTTGRHSVVVEPAGGATGSVQAWLSVDRTGSVTPGTAATFTTTRPGENVAIGFGGVAGQLLRLVVSALVTAPAAQGVQLVLFRPDGVAIASTSTATVPHSWDVPALPVSGTYTLFVEPVPNGKGAATSSVTLKLVPR